jgi:hypothetical protein
MAANVTREIRLSDEQRLDWLRLIRSENAICETLLDQ